MMSIRIKGYSFQLSAPYGAGTVLTRGEAQALNNLRAENIQNNIRKLVVDATAELLPGQLLEPGKLAELQAKITQYDRGYQFLEKHSPKPRVGEIELETRAVAQERVEAALRAEGLEDSTSPAELEELIQAQLELPAVIEEARARVATRHRVLSEGLGDL